MDYLGQIILSAYGLAALFVFVSLIVLVRIRLKEKKKEDFEKRDN
jgi:hypothetical protein